MKILWYLILCFAAVNLVAASNHDVQPKQIHLSYTSQVDEMVVTWTTFAPVKPSFVVFGLTNRTLNNEATATQTVFVDGGSEKRILFIHSATLTELKSRKIYYYKVGNGQVWSGIFNFRARDISPLWNPTFAVYGDMGYQNAVILPFLKEEVKKGTVDAILHIGDFAYDLNSNNSRVGDAFMQQIQPISAHIPYMTCVGNHEEAYNFSNYRYRFNMPVDQKMQLFYSFNIGAAHIISVSTEAYYYDTYHITGGSEAIRSQYLWLINDLKVANGEKQRLQHSWIIVVGHRPMYCSNNDGLTEHCNNLYNNHVRTGYPTSHLPGLEDLFYKYGVDLQFYAHEHSYERLWPVYNLTVCNGTESPYAEPNAPVHIISGSGGNSEGQTKFDHVVYPWSAFHSDDFSYTRMKIVNSTLLKLEQVSADQGGKVIDTMDLIKSEHGANRYSCHKLAKLQSK